MMEQAVGVLGWLVIVALNLGVFLLLLLRSNASQRKHTQAMPGFEAGHSARWRVMCVSSPNQ